MNPSLESARRSLATAARALDDYKGVSGAPGAEEPPASGWRVPAETGARAALDEARLRIAELTAELDKARLAGAEASGAAEKAARNEARIREELEAASARLGAVEAELNAARAALDAAAERERASQEARAEQEAAWTARLALLEGEALKTARGEAQRELAAQKARAASLEAELETARATANALESEAAALREAAKARAASRAEAQSSAEAQQKRAAEAAARVSLLEAECVRLDKLRREADRAAADAEAQGREVAEGLRRELRSANAALDRAAADAGAAEAKSRSEIEGLRARLEAATARLQGLEREKRLEAARGSGDAAAMQAELLRAQAVAASLRLELSSVRAAGERHEDEQRRELSAVRLALDEARRALADHLARTPPPPPEEPRAMDAPPAEPEASSFVQPALEPVLDPGWARLVRLVRPPVEAAYAQLRRLSATSLSAGQKALLRMAAASIVQATDSLSSIELALEEGPAPGSPSPAVPVLESSLAAWDASFRSRGVSLLREFAAPPLPDAAHDPKELRVALHHVLRNVLEAVPRGGRLAVRAWRGPDGGLRVEFADDGPGFPREWLERRFEPFSSPRRGRAGLGLSIVRRTMRRWGGDAEAVNGPMGRGARLTLLFAPPSPLRATAFPSARTP